MLYCIVLYTYLMVSSAFTPASAPVLQLKAIQVLRNARWCGGHMDQYRLALQRGMVQPC